MILDYGEGKGSLAAQEQERTESSSPSRGFFRLCGNTGTKAMSALLRREISIQIIAGLSKHIEAGP